MIDAVSETKRCPPYVLLFLLTCCVHVLVGFLHASMVPQLVHQLVPQLVPQSMMYQPLVPQLNGHAALENQPLY